MIQKANKNCSNSETIDCYRALIPKFCEIPASCRFASGIWKRKLCFWMLLVSTSRTNFLETTYPAQRTTMNTYPEYLYTNIHIQIKNRDWVSSFINIHHHVRFVVYPCPHLDIERFQVDGSIEVNPCLTPKKTHRSPTKFSHLQNLWPFFPHVQRWWSNTYYIKL